MVYTLKNNKPDTISPTPITSNVDPLDKSSHWVTQEINLEEPNRTDVMDTNTPSFQPVLHDWCNKGHGMCYPVCGMVHIKEPLLLIGKSSPCGSSGFPLSLY